MSYPRQLSVIPDQVLEAHTCRVCENYLTVSPISIDPQGGNICGRCQPNSPKQDPTDTKRKTPLFKCSFDLGVIDAQQIDIPYAIFGYANHLFPCINRFEGCTKLLEFHEIVAHEAICKSHKTACGCCEFKGTGAQLIGHFKISHADRLIVDRKNFRIPCRNGSIYLVKCDGNLFFLRTEVDETLYQVRFYLESVKNSLEEGVDFFCLLKDHDGEVYDQMTVSRKATHRIHHYITLKNKELFTLLDDVNKNGFIFVECLLK